MFYTVNALREEKPGEKWRALFDKYWSNYERWYISEGYTARPGYLTCWEQIETHMPEILPVYENLCELAGGGDLPSRFLSLYNPPPYLSGCSQLAWTKGKNALIRNYDYTPRLFDGVFLYSHWLKPVMAMVDCMWGALDGINGDGLSVSLSFGGRNVYGQGFGIPIILRYLLETCSTVHEALAAMQRLPIHMQYNVTVLDANGESVTVFLSPNKAAEVSHFPLATNHQHQVEWEEYAQLTRTVERKECLMEAIHNPNETFKTVREKFLKPPLYNTDFRKGFGTLYTSVYHPNKKKVQLLWPSKKHTFSFDNFEEKKIVINTGEEVMSKMTL